MEKSAVEWFVDQIAENLGIRVKNSSMGMSLIQKAKEMEQEQKGYTESDMRSYASYILNNPVIEPSQWYKIYRTKSE